MAQPATSCRAGPTSSQGLFWKRPARLRFSCCALPSALSAGFRFRPRSHSPHRPKNPCRESVTRNLDLETIFFHEPPGYGDCFQLRTVSSVRCDPHRSSSRFPKRAPSIPKPLVRSAANCVVSRYFCFWLLFFFLFWRTASFREFHAPHLRLRLLLTVSGSSEKIAAQPEGSSVNGVRPPQTQRFSSTPAAGLSSPSLVTADAQLPAFASNLGLVSQPLRNCLFFLAPRLYQEPRGGQKIVSQAIAM